MLDKQWQIFSETPPDLSDLAFLSRLRRAPATGAGLRWTMLLLGGAVVGGILLFYAWVLLPDSLAHAVGLPASRGHITNAGHIFFGIVCALGLAGLRFAVRLFADEAPYRLPPETLRRYELRQAEVTGFGTWMSFGSESHRFQRVHWRMGETTGTSPYVAVTLAIWLRPRDVAWIGVDPAGKGPPIFLGVRRAAPEVLLGEPNNLRAIYEALKLHLEEGGDARKERLREVRSGHFR